MEATNGANAAVSWMWTLVLVPVIVAAFKNEIGGIWEDWRIYKNRLYDKDGQPDSADFCQLCNASTGKKFICIIERYKFWPDLAFKWKVLPYLKCERGLYIAIVNPGGKTMDKKFISFKAWRGMDHRQLEEEVPPKYRDAMNELGIAG